MRTMRLAARTDSTRVTMRFSFRPSGFDAGEVGEDLVVDAVVGGWCGGGRSRSLVSWFGLVCWRGEAG